MDEVILTTEIVVGVVFLLVAAFLIVTLVRRRLIARSAAPSLCTLRVHDDRWRSGLLKQTAGSLEWYPLFGLLPRPGHVWRRGSVTVEGARQADLNAASWAIGIVTPMQVAFVADDPPAPARFDLVLAGGAYTALRAWLEAAPPSDDRYGA